MRIEALVDGMHMEMQTRAQGVGGGHETAAQRAARTGMDWMDGDECNAFQETPRQIDSTKRFSFPLVP